MLTLSFHDSTNFSISRCKPAQLLDAPAGKVHADAPAAVRWPDGPSVSRKPRSLVTRTCTNPSEMAFQQAVIFYIFPVGKLCRLTHAEDLFLCLDYNRID